MSLTSSLSEMVRRHFHRRRGSLTVGADSQMPRSNPGDCADGVDCVIRVVGRERTRSSFDHIWIIPSIGLSGQRALDRAPTSHRRCGPPVPTLSGADPSDPQDRVPPLNRVRQPSWVGAVDGPVVPQGPSERAEKNAASPASRPAQGSRRRETAGASRSSGRRRRRHWSAR